MLEFGRPTNLCGGGSKACSSRASARRHSGLRVHASNLKNGTGLVELHRHLDASVRLPTLLRLAKQHSLLPQDTTLESFTQDFVISQPVASLAAALEVFYLLPKVFSSEEILELVAFEVVEDCYNDGIRQAELRWSPTFVCHTHKHLTWQQCLDAFHRGITSALKQYPDMQAGMICIASREYGPDQAAETVDFFLRNRDKLIGVDLAGDEANWPNRLFESAFAPARAAGACITIHAGEALGPDNIWAAIDLLGAQRIGHACSATQDPLLLEHMRQKQVCIESCPSSNWITRAVPSLEEHPLPAWLRSGLHVSINTDDPVIFGVNMQQELHLCQTVLGLTPEEIQLSQQYARKHSFLTKQPVMAKAG